MVVCCARPRPRPHPHCTVKGIPDLPICEPKIPSLPFAKGREPDRRPLWLPFRSGHSPFPDKKNNQSLLSSLTQYLLAHLFRNCATLSFVGGFGGHDRCPNAPFAVQPVQYALPDFGFSGGERGWNSLEWREEPSAPIFFFITRGWTRASLWADDLGGLLMRGGE